MQNKDHKQKSHLDTIKSYLGNDQRTDVALEKIDSAMGDLSDIMVSLNRSFNKLYSASGLLLSRIYSKIPSVEIIAPEPLLWMFSNKQQPAIPDSEPDSDDKDVINWNILLDEDEKINRLR